MINLAEDSDCFSAEKKKEPAEKKKEPTEKMKQAAEIKQKKCKN